MRATRIHCGMAFVFLQLPTSFLHLTMSGRRISVLLLVITVICDITNGALSFPTAQDASGPRAESIKAAASKISNVKRTHTIRGTSYAVYSGPSYSTNGSLAAQMQHEEQKKLANFSPSFIKRALNKVANSGIVLKSMQGLLDLYDTLLSEFDKPMASDNSDLTFARQRVTYRSFALRPAVLKDLKGIRLDLYDSQLHEMCGCAMADMWRSTTLYVEDFSTIAQWNDPTHPEKHVPNVVGFFCYSKASRRFLPIEIRFPDSNYSVPYFRGHDHWTLAKMALDTASNAYHQMVHVAETHAVLVPIRVEMLRHMASEHPVRTLFLYHTYGAMASEAELLATHLQDKSALDKTFGWGASGSTAFLHSRVTRDVFIRNDFLTEARNRGLHELRRLSKYVQYGGAYWIALADFIGRYLAVYYPSDAAVKGDQELQHWKDACVEIPQLQGFPLTLATRMQLGELLLHLIFTTTVRNHMASGMATWHSLNLPYSPAALWKPMLNETLKYDQWVPLREYTAPSGLVASVIEYSASFYKQIPASESMLGVYKTAPFKDEPRLTRAIADLHERLPSSPTANRRKRGPLSSYAHRDCPTTRSSSRIRVLPIVVGCH